MRFLCRLGRHVWEYVTGSEQHVAWQEKCKHCGKVVDRSGFDGW
ncbi:hypothetical protein EVB39_025 [Rhizobium phage RHph_TM3_3_9]|nr:hypothetical protein EVB39_025 [Rhizobium phage RHph_TM3_3_9]QIG68546.1 hypothetical protein EVB66_025 [Rhizobium phage RHph_TM3_3_13]QIG74404.1 hypothetical protein EVC09_024 [Rhizobium phage RHph_TM3_3_10]QXV74517.1 hypothetical protein [Rhizobium phage RHEph19]